jgi:hypothetical protein
LIFLKKRCNEFFYGKGGGVACVWFFVCLFVCLLLNQSQSSSCARRKDSVAKYKRAYSGRFFAEKEKKKEVTQLAEEKKSLFFSRG